MSFTGKLGTSDSELGNLLPGTGDSVPFGFGQAQALLNTGFGLGQAQTDIKVTTNAFGQTNSYIYITSRKFGQALALIVPHKGLLAYFFQAGTTTLIAPDIPAAYVGTYAETAASKPAYFSGGPSTRPPLWQTDNNFGIRWVKWFVADVTGSWAFATRSDDGSQINIYDEAGTSLIGQVNNNYGGGQGSTYVTGNISLTNGTRYKLEVKWGQQGGGWSIEAFYRRPGAGGDSYLTDGNPPWMGAIFPQYGQAQVYIITGTRQFGQAQAYIQGLVFAQANADILATTNKSAQSQADILVLGNNRSGQANADILVTTNKFAQAQALIIRVVFAQSQASILATTNQWGQANVSIRVIRSTFGQAQADILVTNTTYAQAQAQIIQVVFGQAQARLISFNVPHFGQANADIKATSNKSGQSNADILVTSRVYAQSAVVIRNKHWNSAQANALIHQLQYRGYGQARTSIKAVTRGYAQANALLLFPHTDHACAQAQALIGHFVGGQAQGYISAFGVNRYAQAQAKIRTYDTSRFGQALATLATKTWVSGQAQAMISKPYWKWAQARCYVIGSIAVGQAQAQIHSIVGTPVYAQALAEIASNRVQIGFAQALIARSIKFANAQAFIFNQTAGKLVKYNNYTLPGYLQNETFNSVEEIVINGQRPVTEYYGLRNKEIPLTLLILADTYQAAKAQILEAASMLRSNRSGWSRLSIHRTDRYYLAKTKSISMSQQAGTKENAAAYTVTFETTPWLYGAEHEINGTTLVDTGARSLDDGTWTPATLTLTGTDITISGYTDTGDFTGYVSVSGAVTNLVVDTENYSATMNGVNKNEMMNYEYQLYIGSGKTNFAVTGATACSIKYTDRWSL